MNETQVTPLRLHKLADRSEGSRATLYRVPKGSVVEENGYVVFDAAAAERILVNPETPGYDHEPWPSAGMKFRDDEVPYRTRVSQRQIATLKAEGAVETEGEKIEYVPGGPAENPAAVTHAFVQLDSVTFKTVDGDVRYRVVRNPGKYEDADEASGYRIDWFYELEREHAEQAELAPAPAEGGEA